MGTPAKKPTSQKANNQTQTVHQRHASSASEHGSVDPCLGSGEQRTINTRSICSLALTLSLSPIAIMCKKNQVPKMTSRNCNEVTDRRAPPLAERFEELAERWSFSNATRRLWPERLPIAEGWCLLLYTSPVTRERISLGSTNRPALRLGNESYLNSDSSRSLSSGAMTTCVRVTA